MRTVAVLVIFVVLINGCNHPRKGPYPFSPMTSICFPVKADEQTKVTLFDVQGALRAVLWDTTLAEACTICTRDSTYYCMDSGETHTSPFSFPFLETGIYFYKVETPDSSYTRKTVIMR